MSIRKLAALAATTLAVATVGVATASSASADTCTSQAFQLFGSSGEVCFAYQGIGDVGQGGFYRYCPGDHYGYISTDAGYLNFSPWTCHNLPTNTFVFYVNLKS